MWQLPEKQAEASSVEGCQLMYGRDIRKANVKLVIFIIIGKYTNFEFFTNNAKTTFLRTP